MQNDREIQHILSLLRRTFEGEAWHGPTVKQALAGISDEQAFTRLPNTHSIIELVAHMAVWKQYVTKKLRGDTEYRVTDEINFSKPRDWNETKNRLQESHLELLASIATLPADILSEQVPWTHDPFTYFTVLHGIIHHDLYHAGQIILIKKSFL